MEFYTSIAESDFPKVELTTQSNLLFLGSCFTERVGAKLQNIGMLSDVNPCGIAYNPLSLCRLIEMAMVGQKLTEDNLIHNNDLWHHFDFHGDFSRQDAPQILEQIGIAQDRLRKTIENADIIFLSLGSAFAFRHMESGVLVNNCHKIPGSAFRRELIPLEDVTTVLTSTIKLIKTVNEDCRIVFTVSPVKHLRDGLVSNRRSKSILIEACHRVCESSASLYFPAYELLVDQLRDYRFYDDDLAHPALVAVEIIYQKFLQQFFSDEARKVIGQLEKVRSFIDHRPINPDSSAHQSAVAKQLGILDTLQSEHPKLRTQGLIDLLSAT